MRKMLIVKCVGALTFSGALGLYALGCGTASTDAITSAPVADGGADTSPVAPDAGSDAPESKDGGGLTDATPNADAHADAAIPAPTGLALALGAQLTLIGVTSDGYVVYQDSTKYYAVRIVGGTPAVIANIADVESPRVEGPYVLYRRTVAGPSLLTEVWTAGAAHVLGANIGNVVVSPDGTTLAFSVPRPGGLASLVVESPPFVGSTVILPDVRCVMEVRFAPNNDVNAKYCTGVIAAYTVSAFRGPSHTEAKVATGDVEWTTSPNGEWFLTYDPSAHGYDFSITHVTDGATFNTAGSGTRPSVDPTLSVFDHQNRSLYYADLSGFARLDLTTAQSTIIGNSFDVCPLGVSRIAPDDVYALCALTGGQDWTEAYTAADLGRPLPFLNGGWLGFTDDWSYAYGTDGVTSRTNARAVSIHGATVSLGTPHSSLYAIKALSNDVIVLRDGESIRTVDLGGGSLERVLTQAVAHNASAWALSPDRANVAYVSQSAPVGIYVISTR